jgi:hypothetical protein
MKILKTFIAGGQVKQLRPVVSIENGLLYNTLAKTQVEKDNSERFTIKTVETCRILSRKDGKVASVERPWSEYFGAPEE